MTEGDAAAADPADSGTDDDPNAEVEPDGDVDTDGDEHADGNADAEADDRDDDTVPSVELQLYQVSVSVTGRSDDELGDVEESATRLLDRLVDRAAELEEHPDDRGLG